MRHVVVKGASQTEHCPFNPSVLRFGFRAGHFFTISICRTYLQILINDLQLIK